MVSRFVRRVRTASGSVAVQVVTRQGRAVVEVDHVGSARTDAEFALLLAVAAQRLRPGKDALDLGEVETVSARMDDIADWTSSDASVLLPEVSRSRGPGRDGSGRPGRAGEAGVSLRPRTGSGQGKVVSTSSLLLWDVLARTYAQLGFDLSRVTAPVQGM